MKSLALDSKVLRGTFTGDTGKDGEGLFLASIVNFGNLYYGNIDYSYYMVYDIMAITADKDNFINYKDILLESTNSIEFTESYVKQTIDDGNERTKQALAINAQIQQAFDSYNSAWENRQKSYDIISQKQSDATLGYERVYDTDTGEIYKAYNGFIQIGEKVDVMFSDNGRYYIIEYNNGTTLTYYFQNNYYNKDNVNYKTYNYDELRKIKIPEEIVNRQVKS